jgi:hypothetical protein
LVRLKPENSSKKATSGNWKEPGEKRAVKAESDSDPDPDGLSHLARASRQCNGVARPEAVIECLNHNFVLFLKYHLSIVNTHYLFGSKMRNDN